MADVDKARDLLIRTAYDYGCGVWLLLRAGLHEDAEDCAYDAWAARWRSRLTRESRRPRERAEAMRRVNPAFIPRNHRVERALDAAVEHEDFSLFEELLTVLSRPYEDQEAFASYAIPPRAEERVLQTFCGT